jgi:hypothetical protein
MLGAEIPRPGQIAWGNGGNEVRRGSSSSRAVCAAYLIVGCSQSGMCVAVPCRALTGLTTDDTNFGGAALLTSAAR